MTARTLHILTLGALLLLLAACEDDVAGPTGVEEPFSMYGIINPRLETQTLLVSPIEDRLDPLGRSIDAAVRSTDLTTGTEYVWQDSVVANETGQLDHVFWADFRPDFGSRHHIEVIRSDGSGSTAAADVPARVSIEQQDTGTRFLDVAVRGEDIRLIRIDVTYAVRGFFASRGPDSLGPYSAYTFSRTGTQLRDDDGWRLRINLATDYEPARSLYFLDHGWQFRNPVCGGLGLIGLKIEITVGSDDWDPPGGVFDPNALIQPGTLSNVENGYGFVAGGYNEERSLFPSTRTLDDTWFFDFIDDREPEIVGCGQQPGQ